MDGAGEGRVAGGGGSRRRQGDGGRPASPDFRERAVQLACCLEGRDGGDAGADGNAVHPAGGVWGGRPSRYSEAGTAAAARAGVTRVHARQRHWGWRDRDCTAERCPGQRRCFREREGAVACAARDEGGDMISLSPGTKVFLACQPIDLRAGFNGLAAKVQQVIGQSPFDGSLFIFRGKRGDYFKAIYWDGSGLCVSWS